MTEFEAFMCGLIMGESSSAKTPVSNGPKRNLNIGLQDVAFCQCLRNIVDSLEEYVRESHPTPEEFIRHLIPKTEFEQPYTKDEKEKIAANERSVKKYLEWINDKRRTKTLIGGEKWESLSAIRMIWQDEEYTPDFDNLDLLFGHELFSKPVKHNGRVYEYNSHDPAHLSGIATAFFTSVPARIIEVMCYNCSQEIVKKYGYEFDRSRFDYNYHAEKADNLKAWKKESRYTAYKILLHDMPTFCKATWSDYTVVLKEFEAYKHWERKPIDKAEIKRRREETRQVCGMLTADERKKYAVDNIKGLPTVWSIIGVIVLLTIAMVIVLALVADSATEEVAEILNGILFGGIAISITAIIFLIIITTGPQKRHGGVDRRVYDYMTVLQDAYYNNANENCARKYAAFLERIKENQGTDNNLGNE